MEVMRRSPGTFCTRALALEELMSADKPLFRKDSHVNRHRRHVGFPKA